MLENFNLDDARFYTAAVRTEGTNYSNSFQPLKTKNTISHDFLNIFTTCCQDGKSDKTVA